MWQSERIGFGVEQTHADAHAQMHARTRTRTHKKTHTDAHAQMHARTRTDTHTDTHTHTQMHAQTRTDTYYTCDMICGHQLTKPVKLEVGIKTGCPWSAVNFIVALNHWMKWLCLLAPPGSTSPNPVQAFADDVLLATREEDVITNMLSHTDCFLQWSGLEVKNSKCAVFYERRSGGNRWYRAKHDHPLSFTIA